MRVGLLGGCNLGVGGSTTIHMARGCVVTIWNTWGHSHMLFTVLFTPCQ